MPNHKQCPICSEQLDVYSYCSRVYCSSKCKTRAYRIRKEKEAIQSEEIPVEVVTRREIEDGKRDLRVIQG